MFKILLFSSIALLTISWAVMTFGDDAPSWGGGVVAKEFEVEQVNELICRPGYSPQGKVRDSFLDCRKQLKATHEANDTRACARVCIWHDLGFLDESKTPNVTRIELVMDDVYPGEAGRASAKAYAEDWAACFKETNPRVDYDGEGCKSNAKFQECFRARSCK